MVLNVGAFAIELAQGPHLTKFLATYAVIPLEYSQRMDLPPTLSLPYWTTVLTAMFLHGGWLHLLANMIFLRVFGDNVEMAAGSLRFLLFYLACGAVGSAAHIVSNPASTVPSLGASGAIAGVLGAYWLLFPKNRVHVLAWGGVMALPASLVLGFWMAMQVFSGFFQWLTPVGSGGGVAYMAHIGGFATGLLLAPLFGRGEARPSSRQRGGY
jgi:membrane associated rhomboid family serine protease